MSARFVKPSVTAGKPSSRPCRGRGYGFAAIVSRIAANASAGRCMVWWHFLSEIQALKIDLYLRQQGLDTTTPAGKAMFQIMGVFAEFERAMIQERVRAGLARAGDAAKAEAAVQAALV